MIPKTRFALLIGCLMLMSSAAQAVVLFESPQLTSDSTGWCSPCSTSWQMFDQFTLSTSASVTGASVQLNNFDSMTSRTINVMIRSGDFSSVLYNNDFIFGNYSITAASPLDIYSFDLGSIALSAGNYWISFFGADGGTFTFNQSSYTGGANVGRQAHSYGATTYEERGTTGGIKIFGGDSEEIPAPATLVLMGLGLIGLRLSQNRKT